MIWLFADEKKSEWGRSFEKIGLKQLDSCEKRVIIASSKKN